MTDLEQLQTIKTNTLAILVDLTANPKPSYSINGQSVSWESYYAQLLAQLERINSLIRVEGGPVEIATVGVA